MGKYPGKLHQIQVSTMLIYSIFIIFTIEYATAGKNIEEEQYGVKYATECEVCKLVTKEVIEQLSLKNLLELLRLGIDRILKEKKLLIIDRSYV